MVLGIFCNCVIISRKHRKADYMKEFDNNNHIVVIVI